MADSATECLLFPDLFHKPVHVSFSDQHLSSDGGLLLVKARDKKLGLTHALAQAMRDRRQPGKVEHALADEVHQRI